MSPELYFIYDSHCPWSYASAALINELEQAYPEMIIHAWHCAYYNGDDGVGHKQLADVAKKSPVKFTQPYLRSAEKPKNSVMAANFMAWLHHKYPEKELTVLNVLQQAHFTKGNPFASVDDFSAIIEQLKLSPPNKIFRDKLSEEAEYILSDIAELQEFMGTTAFPALLLTVGEKALLLDHSLYLGNPARIVNAVKKQLQ